MKKRILSLLLLCFLLIAIALSFSSCAGNENVRGLVVDRTVSNKYYNEETGLTSLDLDVFATNDNGSRAIKSYKFRVVFRDSRGSILSSSIYNGHDGIMPYNTESQSLYFSESDGSAIEGNVASVEVYPAQMVLSNFGVDDSDDEEAPEWGFWAWFWTIVSGILAILFISCCVDGDRDSIIGGVVIFLIPAIIILVVYFGFIFGSGV